MAERGAPSSPASANACKRTKAGPNRYWNTGKTDLPDCSAAARIASTCAREVANGFSQIACLPASSTAMVTGACMCGGRQMSIRSTSAASASSTVASGMI